MLTFDYYFSFIILFFFQVEGDLVIFVGNDENQQSKTQQFDENFRVEEVC